MVVVLPQSMPRYALPVYEEISFSGTLLLLWREVNSSYSSMLSNNGASLPRLLSDARHESVFFTRSSQLSSQPAFSAYIAAPSATAKRPYSGKRAWVSSSASVSTKRCLRPRQ